MTDLPAFETVYNDYKQLVYNLALHYSLNTEDAQDITQEVFVKVYQHFHKHDPSTASMKTWIYRITVNHCLDFLRSRNAKRRSGFLISLFSKKTNEPLNEMIHFDHPGIIAEDKEELSHLLFIINELPDSQRTALILSKIEDRPQEEVAEIMNTTLKAIESLLQRAKQNLSKKLKESEGL